MNASVVHQVKVGSVESKANDSPARAMACRLCGHPSTHKHGKARNGSQRYCCPQGQPTCNARFDTLSGQRHLTPAPLRQVLPGHSEGSSLRGLSRTSGLAANTVVSLVRAASQQAQWVHNAQVQAVPTQAVSADALWSFGSQNSSQACPRRSQQALVGWQPVGWLQVGAAWPQASGSTPMHGSKHEWSAVKAKLLVNDSIVMMGAVRHESCLPHFGTILAKTRPNAESAPRGWFDHKPDPGSADSTRLASAGSKRQ